MDNVTVEYEAQSREDIRDNNKQHTWTMTINVGKAKERKKTAKGGNSEQQSKHE